MCGQPDRGSRDTAPRRLSAGQAGHVGTSEKLCMGATVQARTQGRFACMAISREVEPSRLAIVMTSPGNAESRADCHDKCRSVVAKATDTRVAPTDLRLFST